MRCKIVPIEKFEPNVHWAIDRWWNKEEKIALGIEKENKTVDVLEFSLLMSDMANTFENFSKILKEIGEKKTLK